MACTVLEAAAQSQKGITENLKAQGGTGSGWRSGRGGAKVRESIWLLKMHSRFNKDGIFV